MTAQAASDWHIFLSRRASELAPGGKLVIVTSLRDEDGLIGAEGIMKLTDQALSEMVADGSLHPAERERMVLPTYYRTEAEFSAPFSDPALGSLLTLEAFHALQQPDPFQPGSDAGEDRIAFGKAVAGFMRAFAEPFFRSCLDAGHAASAGTLADHLFSRVAALASSARDLKSAPRIALLVIRRI